MNNCYKNGKEGLEVMLAKGIDLKEKPRQKSAAIKRGSIGFAIGALVPAAAMLYNVLTGDMNQEYLLQAMTIPISGCCGFIVGYNL